MSKPDVETSGALWTVAIVGGGFLVAALYGIGAVESVRDSVQKRDNAPGSGLITPQGGVYYPTVTPRAYQPPATLEPTLTEQNDDEDRLEPAKPKAPLRTPPPATPTVGFVPADIHAPLFQEKK